MAKRKRAKSPATETPELPISGSEAPGKRRARRRQTADGAAEILPPEVVAAADAASPEEAEEDKPSTREALSRAFPVLPYQDRWIRDDSQLKVAVWSRQSGKSYAAALRAVVKCLGKHTTYIILSKGERQSRLFMEKVKDFCSVLKTIKVLPGYRELPETDDKSMEVFFPHNRSRIIGLPANPDTARGYSGNIVLDEFAFHGDARKIFAACFPIITRGYSIEVISTPNGTAGKFYEIAKEAGLLGSGDSVLGAGEKPQNPEPSTRNLWSGHRVDIYDAVRQGFNADLNLLKAGCDDEETWLQEYCCRFLSDAQNYIPVELISTCVHEEATTEWVLGSGGWGLGKESPQHPASGLQHPAPNTQHPELYLGVDIGRKRDLTIAWLFEKVGGVLWSRHLLTLKGVSFDEQERQICRLIELPMDDGRLSIESGTTLNRHSAIGNRPSAVRRCCIDQSGIGMMLAERLVQKYGAVVEPVQFTAALKERLAPMVKHAFEERTVRIPDNREVRADINSVKRFVTPAGNVRFDAEHTDRGHADRFWALAMVVNAASEPGTSLDDIAGPAGSPVMAGLFSAVL